MINTRSDHLIDQLSSTLSNAMVLAPPIGRSWVVLYLKQGEAEVVLKQDTANAPHITGMAPAQL